MAFIKRWAVIGFVVVLIVACGAQETYSGDDSLQEEIGDRESPESLPAVESDGSVEGGSARPSATGVVTVSSLRVRSLPSLTADIVGAVGQGTEVRIESRTSWSQSIAHSRGPWYLISASDLSGWAYGGMIDIIEHHGIAPSNLTLGDVAPNETTLSHGRELSPDRAGERSIPVTGGDWSVSLPESANFVPYQDDFNPWIYVPIADSPQEVTVTMESPFGDSFVISLPTARPDAQFEIHEITDAETGAPFIAMAIPFHPHAYLPKGVWSLGLVLDGAVENNFAVEIEPHVITLSNAPKPSPFFEAISRNYVPGSSVHIYLRAAGRPLIGLYREIVPPTGPDIRFEPVRLFVADHWEGESWYGALTIGTDLSCQTLAPAFDVGYGLNLMWFDRVVVSGM